MSSTFQTSVDDLSADPSAVQTIDSPVGSSYEGSYEAAPGALGHGEHTHSSASRSSERSDAQGAGSLAKLGGSGARLPNLEPREHSKLFYLSLIEGRCRTQAVHLLNEGRCPADYVSEHDPEVRPLVRRLFAEMSKELHKAGILPDEFAGQDLEDLRARYLNTFDAVLHTIAAKGTNTVSDPSISGSIFRHNELAVGGVFSPSAMERKGKQSQYGGQQSLLSSLILKGGGGEHLPTSIFGTQYGEKSLLGKGGFGQVFKVKNLVDQQDYAVKRIVIRGKDVSLAGNKEQQEALLMEARSLSKLNHQNIVRYYGVWVETCPAGTSMDGTSSSEALE